MNKWGIVLRWWYFRGCGNIRNGICGYLDFRMDERMWELSRVLLDRWCWGNCWGLGGCWRGNSCDCVGLGLRVDELRLGGSCGGFWRVLDCLRYDWNNRNNGNNWSRLDCHCWGRSVPSVVISIWNARRYNICHLGCQITGIGRIINDWVYRSHIFRVIVTSCGFPSNYMWCGIDHVIVSGCVVLYDLRLEPVYCVVGSRWWNNDGSGYVWGLRDDRSYGFLWLRGLLQLAETACT